MGLGAIAPGTEDAGCEEGAPEERLLCSWIAAAAAWGGGGPPDGFLLIDPVSFEAALDKGDLCGERNWEIVMEFQKVKEERVKRNL